jgi:plasmid stabilization system protein ParE
MNHAASYVDFLRTRTDRLSADFALGRPVPTNPRFLYRVIQKRTKRHGHIVVYEVTETELIRILRYFHTAQDWQKALD